ncbi:hypothetical protein [Rhodococcus qingshengii]|uniref:hypothetical protein n=1 Tax=Rhodococcus TaxID=1827 RepID=UPI001BAEAEAE|nr:hypothetical protein [Rhodococcus qingshengii]MBS3695703.1 hypothetical protein [Rhodococcus qingshengii]
MFVVTEMVGKRLISVTGMDELPRLQVTSKHTKFHSPAALLASTFPYRNTVRQILHNFPESAKSIATPKRSPVDNHKKSPKNNCHPPIFRVLLIDKSGHTISVIGIVSACTHTTRLE